MEDHLEYIEKEALQKFRSIDPGTEVPVESLWTSPVSVIWIFRRECATKRSYIMGVSGLKDVTHGNALQMQTCP